jgi:hypothetical protein
MFKEATRLKLRFVTNKGTLSTEQLWDLSLQDLDSLAVSLEKAYNESKGKSFLVRKNAKDKGLKLQFDIALEILQTKVEEAELAREAAENKQHNQKIMALIAEKQDEELKEKSVAELKRMLKD